MAASSVWPRLIELTERWASANAVRQRVAECAVGHVLELRSPAGSNPWHYPRSITSLTIIASSQSKRTAPRRHRDLPFPIDLRSGMFGQLPAKSQAYDCVVSTFALRTLSDLTPALDEIKRVLKPGGRLLFAEYSLSHEPTLSLKQHRLRYVQRWLTGVNSPLDFFDEQLTAAGFVIKSCECTALARIPAALGQVQEGIAVLN